MVAVAHRDPAYEIVWVLLFQAEDGIRDYKVTGVQTCALPICTDRIERTIDLKVPPTRVWRALTDHDEFGTWFRVKLDGPFVPGQTSTGHITYPGYEQDRKSVV